MQKKALKNGLPFMKMHGAGNDFVVLDSRDGEPVVTPALARAIGDRNLGVGFDQLAEIRPCDDSDIRIDFWNADGSPAGACGNASRCIAQHYLAKTGLDKMSMQTQRGQLVAVLDRGGVIHVNMGQPEFKWDKIPLAKPTDTDHLPIDGDPAAVGMGNPHCVFFVDDVAAIDVAKRGAEIEHHPLFRLGTNVEFAEARSKSTIRMRVWERGTGITLACGSGACATVVASHRRGLTERKVAVQADGGQLIIDWRDDGVWMAGPVAHVFSGTLSAEFLDTANG